MKLKVTVAALIGCLVGLFTGFYLATRAGFPKFYNDIALMAQSLSNDERLATSLSLWALLELEHDNTEKVKAKLAQQAADYYRANRKKDASPTEIQEFLRSIESASADSPALKTELAKELNGLR